MLNSYSLRNQEKSPPNGGDFLCLSVIPTKVGIQVKEQFHFSTFDSKSTKTAESK